jgi:ABC-type transport system involved in multi-copper enzyme maturation permease subunit
LIKLLKNWAADWKQDPITSLFETVGTAASMLAAVLLSFKLSGLVLVYVFWMLGSICLIVSCWRRQNINLMTLMLFYTVLNLIGFWNYL